ncbi:MAG: hypothetical protein MUE69_20760 [Myxococcota bacterium]|jgi:hypothetical protein|nr:hypothetical protein [Myxococcota bacterium]
MNRIGSLNPNFVWLFALGATLLGVVSGYVTQGASASVASAVYFGIFTASAFGATLLTSSGVGRTVLAFLIASLLSAGGYYFVVASTTQAATEALGGGEGAGMMGAVMGGFVAGVVLLGTFVAGVTGAVAGGRFRAKLQSA